MTPRQQLEEMLDRFDPAVSALARGALERVRRLVPGAVQMVYDNTYALVVGFSATDRASEALLSVVIYPRKVSLCFIWGATLADPDHLLQGEGRQVRHIRLNAVPDLDAAPVRRLLRAEVDASETPFAGKRGRMEIRMVAKKRRARRLGASAGR